MRHKAMILLALLGCLLLLTGCSSMLGGGSAMGNMAQNNTPAATETQPPEPLTVTMPSEPVNTVILRECEDLGTEYYLTTLNPWARYLGEPRQINSQGAEALVRWLCTQEARDQLDACRDGMFRSRPEVPVYSGWISPAQNATKTIQLLADTDLVSMGLLEELLSAFTEAYGYQVEVTEMDSQELFASAALGEADLLLSRMPPEDILFENANYYRQIPGFSATHVPLCLVPYVLCGPESDPAGAAQAKTMEAALTAIEQAECYFISRGDDSDVHQAELAIWEDKPQGDWYFEAGTDMGPCLVIAEEMAGYLLSDRLTYEIFARENGVIG